MKPYKSIFREKNKYLEMATLLRFSKNGYYYIQVVSREGAIPHFHLTNKQKFILKVIIPDVAPDDYSDIQYINWKQQQKFMPDNITDILKELVVLLKSKPDKTNFPTLLDAIKYQWDVNNPEYAKFGYKPY
ncbi:MAG TPA: hypothetical protein PKX62_16500 [Spirochaetota bacterium]|nr:hypothetical protein [Bacteroidales bacterium]HQF09712.1 hypothetical protein [Spirochaetota bacterium]HRS78496.1 hypothetical protein [Spirochaetota bacterium]